MHGLWSQAIELQGSAIEVKVPTPWEDIRTIRLVEEGSGTDP